MREVYSCHASAKRWEIDRGSRCFRAEWRITRNGIVKYSPAVGILTAMRSKMRHKKMVENVAEPFTRYQQKKVQQRRTRSMEGMPGRSGVVDEGGQ